MKRNTTLSALVMAAGLATAGSLVYAKSPIAENDALVNLAQAKITLNQAIVAAEAHASGKAIKAELSSERGTETYTVEVVTGDKKVFEVNVDATDGKVLSSKQDRADDGDDEEDGENAD